MDEDHSNPSDDHHAADQHEHHLPIPTDGVFDLSPIPQKELNDQFQFLEQLASNIPPEWRDKPLEEQKQLLIHMLNHFRRHETLEEGKFKKLREDYQKLVRSQYKFLHPELLTLDTWEFDEGFMKAIRSDSPSQLDKFLCEESEYLYSIPMLKPDFCKKIVEEIDHFERWSEQHGLQVNRPNSMNNYGAILDDFGMEPVLDSLMRTIVSKISALKFPHIKDQLDEHHGFAVEYALDKDRKLDFHVDDSEVTLNVCLGTEFEGGELYFGGLRCAKHQQDPPKHEEQFLVAHEVGGALIHLGRHRHAATPIRSGRRVNLILWCRSSPWRKVENLLTCAPWCGSFQPPH